MFGLEKFMKSSKMKESIYEESEKKEVYKLLGEIFKKIKKEEDYTELKERVLELSNEWNKDLLFEDFENKVKVFISYEEEAKDFPLNPWVDSFFENLI